MLGMVEDPVCGMEINIETAPAKTQYRGETYYFHSLECKEAFEQDPERYIFIEEEDT
jgi:YHS domain-containing protein